MFTSPRFLWPLILAFGLRAGAAVPPPETLLPKDTLFVATAPDWAKARLFWSNNPYSSLWQEPGLKPFTDKFFDKLSSTVIHPLEQNWGMKFSDFQGLLQGQVTLALVPVTPKNKSDRRVAALLVLDTKDHAGQLKTNLAEVLKKWAEAGKPMKSQKLREKDFTTLFVSPEDLSLKKILPSVAPAVAPEEDTPKTPGKNLELTLGQADSLLLISDSTEVIDKVLSRQTGGMVPPLEEAPVFQADYAARLRGSPFYVWLNGKALVDLLAKPPAEADDDAAASALRLDNVFSATGLANVASVSLSYQSFPEGVGTQLFLAAPADKRPALLKMLTAETKDCSPPSFVPTDAVKYWRWRLNLARSWNALEAMLNDLLPPQIMAQVNMVFSMAGKDKDEHYDLKSELLNNLADDLICYAKAPKGNTMAELRSPPTLYLLGSANPDKLASAIKVLLAIPFQGAVTDREFLGRKIYTAGAAAAGKAPVASVSFSASGGYVAISGDTAILEEYLRSNDSQTKPLMAMPGLGDAAQKVGGMATGLFGFENENQSLRPFFEVLRKQTLSSQDILGFPLPGPMGDYVETFRQWADFSLLPPFDTVAKYFSFSVYAGSFSAEGFTLKMYGTTPPQLRR